MRAFSLPFRRIQTLSRAQFWPPDYQGPLLYKPPRSTEDPTSPRASRRADSMPLRFYRRSHFRTVFDSIHTLSLTSLGSVHPGLGSGFLGLVLHACIMNFAQTLWGVSLLFSCRYVTPIERHAQPPDIYTTISRTTAFHVIHDMFSLHTR